MGWYDEWQCSQCGNKVGTGGPWEFYRDKEGRRQPYGHPEPCPREAREAGIKGFSFLTYCPKCNSVKDLILVEFQKARDYRAAWEGCKRRKLTCGECGGRLHELLDNLICPVCAGVFKRTAGWIS